MPFCPISVPAFRFDGRQARHREVSYAPGDLRRRRPHLYILTDRPEWVEPAFAAATDGVLIDLHDLTDRDIADSAFYVWFSLHDLAVEPLSRIIYCGGLFAPPPVFGKVPYQTVNAHALAAYNDTGEALGATPFMEPEVHAQICQALEITRELIGDFVEIGVFSGSSALTALNYMTRSGIRRTSWLFDTYAGFTYPAAEQSSDLIWAGTHLMDPSKTVERIRGLVEPTGQDVRVVPLEICSADLPDELTEIAVANVDVDLYDAVAAALAKLAPRMTHRGVMIVEDPCSTPGLYGAYVAMSEFLASYWGRKFVPVRTTTQYFLIRVEH